ncbi:MAG: hypothetical protein LBM23_09965 [Propionibacteriaceae bacterium]|jgi:uncharacterized membrane protein|nr:hypothetical protein [Propionibacteriaceae bacterium]
MIRRMRGSGTILTLIVSGFIVLVSAIILAVCLGVIALHEARSGADLAAISAAQAAVDSNLTASESMVCAEAGIGAPPPLSIESCSMTIVGVHVAVTVTVAAPFPWRIPGLPVEVAATSHAGNLP